MPSANTESLAKTQSLDQTLGEFKRRTRREPVPDAPPPRPRTANEMLQAYIDNPDEKDGIVRLPPGFYELEAPLTIHDQDTVIERRGVSFRLGFAHAFRFAPDASFTFLDDPDTEYSAAHPEGESI
jgi:hypothetical protein